MNIGQLFVSLGIKGADKAKQGIGEVSEGLKKTASTSWELKAGILGAMYALERFTAAGNARGTNLTNLSNQLGMTSQEIERYQWAAQQAGVANEAIGASFKAMQSAMATIEIEGMSNKWLGFIQQFTGPIDIDAAMKHPEEMIKRIQQIWNNPSIPLAWKREIAKGVGLEPLSDAFARNEFRPDVLSKAPVHSTAELKQLDKNRAAWANLGTTVNNAMDGLSAKWGAKLVKDLSDLVPVAVKLVDSFTKLADKIHAIEWIGVAFQGWAEIFQSLTDSIDAFDDLIGNGDAFAPDNYVMDPNHPGKGNATASGNSTGKGGSAADGFSYAAEQAAMYYWLKIINWRDDVDAKFGVNHDADVTSHRKSRHHGPISHASGDIHRQAALPSSSLPAAAAAPTIHPTLVNPGGSSQVELHQTFEFPEGRRDAREIASESARQVRAAFRSNPALSRIT